MRQRRIGATAYTAQIQAASRAEAVGCPQQHRHVGLFVGRDGIGRAVQIQAVLAERFAVVGHEQHRGVERDIGSGRFRRTRRDRRAIGHVAACVMAAGHEAGQRRRRVAVDQRPRFAEQRGDVREDMAGVEHAVVVGVAQLRVAAALQFVGTAFGLEDRVLVGIACVVRGSVAAEQMHHDHGVALDRRQHGAQFVHQHLVVAAFGVAVRGSRLAVARFARAHLARPLRQSLAAGVVVQPQHVVTAVHQYIQQVFAMLGDSIVVVAAAQIGKHAGQRGRGIGAAAADLAEIHGGHVMQIEIGIARVAVEVETRGAHGFADRQHQYHRPVAGLRRAAAARVHADPLQRPVVFAGVIQIRQVRRQQRERVGDVAQLHVIAQQRGNILAEAERGDAEQREREQREFQSREDLAQRLFPIHFDPPQQQRRQDAQRADAQQHAQIEPLAGLARVGFVDAGQRMAIDHRAVVADEIRRARGQDQRQRQARFEGPAQAERQQHQQSEREQRGGDGRDHADAVQAVQPRRRQHDPPEAGVERDDHEGHDDQQQGIGAQAGPGGTRESRHAATVRAVA